MQICACTNTTRPRARNRAHRLSLMRTLTRAESRGDFQTSRAVADILGDLQLRCWCGAELDLDPWAHIP